MCWHTFYRQTFCFFSLCIFIVILFLSLLYTLTLSFCHSLLSFNPLLNIVIQREKRVTLFFRYVRHTFQKSNYHLCNERCVKIHASLEIMKLSLFVLFHVFVLLCLSHFLSLLSSPLLSSVYFILISLTQFQILFVFYLIILYFLLHCTLPFFISVFLHMKSFTYQHLESWVLVVQFLYCMFLWYEKKNERIVGF